MDPDLAAYCDRVEHEFFRLKGRPGTLSPSDFAKVREWFEAGLGLNSVLEGIADAFGERSGGRDLGMEEVNSLAFCQPFVERAFRKKNPR